MERNILLFFTFKANFVSCCCCLHIHIVRGVFTCLFAVCVRSFLHFMHIFDSRCSAVCFDHPAGIRLLPCCCLLDLISRQSHDLLLLLGRYYIEERLLKAFHFLLLLFLLLLFANLCFCVLCLLRKRKPRQRKLCCQCNLILCPCFAALSFSPICSTYDCVYAPLSDPQIVIRRSGRIACQNSKLSGAYNVNRKRNVTNNRKQMRTCTTKTIEKRYNGLECPYTTYKMLKNYF